MTPKTQQIALDLDPDEPPALDPPLEPERAHRLIALMADAIVALVQPTRRMNDEDE
jgi:hypothetical protein